MHGRRNGRYETGKQMKRIRKKNVIILALICMTSYMLYRAVFAKSPQKTESERVQEAVREDFKRQMNDIQEKLRAGAKDRTLDAVAIGDNQKPAKSPVQKQPSDVKSQFAPESPNVSKEKLQTTKENYDNDVKDRTVIVDAKQIDQNRNKLVTKNVTVGPKSFSSDKDLRNTSKHNNVVHIFPNGTKVYADRHNTKHMLNKNGSKAGPVVSTFDEELLWTLNNTKDEEIEDADVIFFYADDRKPVEADCVDFYVRGGESGKITSKICIHNVTEDKFVSALLKSMGTWEQGDLDGMGAILRDHPDMTLVDGGCNIGAYTVYAATLGNRVIAIDPYYKHLQLLHNSLKLNNKRDRVSLLWNALSKVHLWVNLSQTQARNLGSVNIIVKDPVKHVSNYSVQTIMLDDLVEKFELDKVKVFLKLDIEASEYNALVGGIKFFKRVNVCYVLMEFVTYKVGGRGEEILKFMARFDLYPYADLRLLERLDLKGVPIINYPLNAVFAKKNC